MYCGPNGCLATQFWSQMKQGVYYPKHSNRLVREICFLVKNYTNVRKFCEFELVETDSSVWRHWDHLVGAMTKWKEH